MDYYIFNPENDEALATNTSYYQPSASIICMAHDLSEMQRFIMPTNNAEIYTPGMVLKNGDRIRPWGWSKYLLKRLSDEGVTELPSIEYVEKWRMLSHRRNAALILYKLSDIPECIGEDKEYKSENDIHKLLDDNSKKYVLKAPWSSSGRGVHTYEKDKEKPINNWIRNTLHVQGSVMVEPQYNKLYDFAMEFKTSPNSGVEFVCYSLFKTSPDYHIYLGNVIASDEDIEAFITQYIPYATLQAVRTRLINELSSLLKDSDYDNYIGVDMMICAEGGKYKLHPCVEINLRMNMGVFAHIFYERSVSHNSIGFFNIKYFKNGISPVVENEKMTARSPLNYDNSGRITDGYISLSSIKKNTKFHAMAIINPRNLLKRCVDIFH